MVIKLSCESNCKSIETERGRGQSDNVVMVMEQADMLHRLGIHFPLNSVIWLGYWREDLRPVLQRIDREHR